jgi:hypothetical protein
MAIGDGHTQGALVTGRVFHLATIVADAKIALLEDTKLGINLHDAGLTVTEELGLDIEPCLSSSLRWLAEDLVEVDRDGPQAPGEHDVVKPSPIGGRVNDVGDDMIVEGIEAVCEEHLVMPALVVGRERLQNIVAIN